MKSVSESATYTGVDFRLKSGFTKLAGKKSLTARSSWSLFFFPCLNQVCRLQAKLCSDQCVTCSLKPSVYTL